MDKDDIDQALENAFAGIGDLGQFDFVKDDNSGQWVKKTKVVNKKKAKSKVRDMAGKPLLETILEESDVTKNLQIVPMSYEH